MFATGSWAKSLISAVRAGRVVSSRIREFCGSARSRIGGAVKPSVALPGLVLELSQLGRLAGWVSTSFVVCRLDVTGVATVWTSDSTCIKYHRLKGVGRK